MLGSSGFQFTQRFQYIQDFSRTKRPFSCTAYKKALAWLYLTSIQHMMLPISVSLVNTSFDLSPGVKRPKRLKSSIRTSFTARALMHFLLILMLSFTLLVWMNGCMKTKILHFQQFCTTRLYDSTFDKLNIIGDPGFASTISNDPYQILWIPYQMMLTSQWQHVCGLFIIQVPICLT